MIKLESKDTATTTIKKKSKSCRKTGILSPLRYPGGKRRLAGFLAQALQLNQLRPKLFVEPFAGGASVSLYLLYHNLVDCIALGDKDELIADLWKTVFTHPQWLIKEVSKLQPTLDNWNRFKKARYTTSRERALACLFLNRTSFSGLLTPDAGPIGGYDQESAYKIDCRFALDEIIYRIEQLSTLADRVLFVKKGGWQQSVQKAKQQGYALEEVFYYFDPPYYSKAEKLYRYYFDHPGHKQLSRKLHTLQSPWLLSYDAELPIIDLYNQGKNHFFQVELLYSINNSGGLLKAQELIVSNLARLPQLYKSFKMNTKP